MEGWLKLHRKLQESWVWKDKPFARGQAWIDLLFIVNYTDGKTSISGKPVLIQRGQIHTSVSKLAARWGWDRKKVMRFLDVLESDHMIVQKRTSDGTTITIVNYEVYQTNGTTDGTTDGTALGTSDGTQYKNIKKERIKEKNIKKKSPLNRFNDFVQRDINFNELESEFL